MSEMIKVGKHRAKCRGIQLGYTSTGTEQAAVEWDFIDPSDPDHGRSLTQFMFFTANALEYTVENLRTMGWTGTDPSTLPEDAAAGRLGNECELVIVHDQYNGKTSPKVKYVNKVGAFKMKNAMDEAQRRAFGANLKSQIARIGGGTPQSGESAGGTAPASNPDDDIPFATCTLADIDPVRKRWWL